ncbi:MAG: GntR family transcriptional regulator [Eubacteriaceae bacterium]|jgi:DNA-binding GntR family transcriptional regulator|nr:GntR family transcriptional regulator [Eubacteriaceae bacterium]
MIEKNGSLKIRDKLELIQNNNQSLRESVFETLRNAIVEGRLAPGERLTELQLAEELGVSRTPVREAIRKLELEGLARMLPRRGAFVTPMSLQDLVDFMEIRRVLEGLAAELAVRNATDEDIRRMEMNNSFFEEAAIANDEAGIIDYDIAFHEVLYNASGNKKLIAQINSIREQTKRIRMEYVQNVDDKCPLIGEHRRIIEGIVQRDAAKAFKAASDHIKSTELDMIKVLGSDQ